MTDPLYSGEAKILSWGENNTSGRFVRLEIEGGGEHPFRGYEGERFMVVFVPIGNDEKPMAKNCSGREIGRQNVEAMPMNGSQERPQFPSRGAPSVIVDAAATKPKKRWHDMPASQRAALLVKDAEFRHWLQLTADLELEIDEDYAISEVRARCGVQSRSQILPGTSAAANFDEMVGRFHAWRQAKQHGAA